MSVTDLCNLGQIRELLARHDLKLSKSMGQNFLIEKTVPERIAQSAGLDEDAGVIEIGPGVGCLTAELSKRAKRVLAVELDERLRPLLHETLADCGNTRLVFGDVMRLDLGQLADQELTGLRPVLCANLPYNITTPVMVKMIECRRFEIMTVMIQREVARRVCAAPGQAEYGAFTVFVNWHCRPKIMFDVPPGCFYPRPRVVSTVLRLVPRGERPAAVSSEKGFFRVVRAAFAQRRKTLTNALYAAFGQDISKERVALIIESCGFDPKVRGEALDIAGFAAISNKIEEFYKET